MALLFMDGFDHYGSGGSNSSVADSGKWGQLNGSIATIYALGGPPRTGTGKLALYYINDELITKPLPASGGFVIGMAIRFEATPSGSDIIHIKEGTVNHLGVAITAGGVLQVKGGSTVLATGTTVLVQNSWYYVEFKGIIHDTTGSYELRIDGVTEVALTNVGPLDTRSSGGTTGQWDRIGVLSIVPSWSSFIDDLYVCDMSGTIRNDFLGPIKIELLMPQIGNGSNVGLTPSTGTDHGALVDEIPANTTDYNSSATIGTKDTYNLPSVTLSGGILGVQVNLWAAKSDVGGRKVCSVVRTGGVDYDGADLSLLTSFQYVTQVRPQNPGTSADWTVADITALEVGMKVTV